MKNQGLNLKQLAEEKALRILFPVGIITAVLGYIYNFNYEALPILGLHSIGLPMLVASIALTLIFFTYGYWSSLAYQKQTTISKIWNSPKVILNTISLALVHALLVGFFTAVILVIFNYAFQGLQLDRLSSAFILGSYSAVVTYLVIILSMAVTLESLTAVVITFLIVGVLSSMLATTNPNWWEVNFSYLGTFESGAYHLFNATLILTGLVMLVLADILFETARPSLLADKKVKTNRYNWAKRLFIIAAIALAGVGAFSYSRSPTLHNLSAATLAVSFASLMVGIKYFLPVFSKTFYLNSYLLAFMLVFFWVVLLNGINYINLTAYELSAAGICGVWLGLFLRNMGLKTSEDSQINS